MGLTRPRAYQIFDIDYKQAVRVITRTNISLGGGAPSQVDGVNLSLNDRVLVAGQNTGSQNGLYYVTTVGTGSNGTWQRSIDGNETGEIQAGMIVMVTEGTTYADTQWKLITNNPIVIGTTALTFEQTSAYSFGSIAVTGQSSIVADTVGDVLTVVAGNNIALTTDSVTDALTIAVTGISLNSISNGTSNVNVVSSGGNVTVGVGGTSNVAVFSSGGLDVTGNITGNGRGLSGINVFSNVAVTGGNTATADSITDTLTLTAGAGIAITCDASTDTITIAASGGSEIFVDGADFGTVTELVTQSDDLGLVTEAVEAQSDLGSIVTSGVFFPDLLVVNDPSDFQLGGGSNGQYLGTYGNGTIFWQSLASAPLTGNMVGNINGNSFSITGLTTVQATGNVTGANVVATVDVYTPEIVKTGSNAVGNIGQSDNYFNRVFAQATSALYADLAENYVADADYAPGTVVVFGGDKEVTISTVTGDTRVAGVISTNPSYLMNSGLASDHVATVALTGRVPTKVLGPVRKGDLMISTADGYACACNQPVMGSIIGKSLENLDLPTGTIEIVIGVR